MAIPDTSSLAWIINARQDLVWFQGSVMAGLGLLVLFLSLPQPELTGLTIGHPIVLAVFAWGVLFDGTHVWGTYARSYCARDHNSRSGIPSPWWWSLLAVGPVVALLDAFEPGALFGVFLLGAYLWAYWHLVRQHYGFLMLYRKRAGETSLRGAQLDSFILWVGCLYPFLRFSLSPAYTDSSLPELIPAAWIVPATYTLDIGFALGLVTALALVVRGRHEPFRLGPKHLLLIIVISFHCLVLGLLDQLLPILATLTIFHNLQYHRVVWQYEAGLGRRPSGGLAAYLLAGLALGLVWYGLRVPMVVALESQLIANVLIGLCWGVAFHHYLVDSRIWRLRRTPSVAQALEAGTSH